MSLKVSKNLILIAKAAHHWKTVFEVHSVWIEV